MLGCEGLETDRKPLQGDSCSAAVFYLARLSQRGVYVY